MPFFPRSIQQGHQSKETAAREDQRARREGPPSLLDMLDSLPVCVMRKDLEGRITFLNQPLADMLGSTIGELLGKTDYELFPAELAKKRHDDEQFVIETGSLFTEVKKLQSGGGEVRYFEILKSPVRAETGKTIGTMEMTRDITDLMRIEEELGHAKQTADSANALESNLLANMNQEIRTPASRTMGMNELTTEQRESARQLQASAEVLMGMLHDILDYAKVEAAKPELAENQVESTAEGGETVAEGLTVFNERRFREHIGNMALMRDLIDFFLEDSEVMLTEINQTVEEGERESLRRASHSLMGLVGNYWADRSFEKATELDRKARTGDIAGARAVIPELRREITGLRMALQRFGETLGES